MQLNVCITDSMGIYFEVCLTTRLSLSFRHVLEIQSGVKTRKDLLKTLQSKHPYAQLFLTKFNKLWEQLCGSSSEAVATLSKTVALQTIEKLVAGEAKSSSDNPMQPASAFAKYLKHPNTPENVSFWDALRVVSWHVLMIPLALPADLLSQEEVRIFRFTVLRLATALIGCIP